MERHEDSQQFVRVDAFGVSAQPHLYDIASVPFHKTFLPTMKRGYHIYIVLNPESHPSSSQKASNSFIPASLFQPLPNHSSGALVRRNTFSRPQAPTTDYRQGPISVDWMDFDHMGSSGKEKDRGRSNELSIHIPFSLLTDLNTRTCGSHFRSSHAQEIRNY